MGNRRPTTRIVSLLFLLVSVQFQSIPSARADFVTDTCQKTSDPAYCESTLWSDPRSAQASNPELLAKIAFDITTNKALSANRHATDLARQHRRTPEENPLSQCAQIYLDMCMDLHDAVYALRSEQYGKACDIALKVQHAPGQCEEEFEKKNIPSLLSEIDEALSKNCVLCISLTKPLIPGDVLRRN